MILEVSLTNEPMRVSNDLSCAVPVQIEVFSHELDTEAQLHVFEVHTHKRLLVPFTWWCFRDYQFAIDKCDSLDVSRLQNHLVVNVDGVLDGLKAEFGHIGLLVAVVVDDDTHGPQPGDLFSECVGNKHGIHVDLLVADQIEGKAVFSLDSVAEGLAGGESDCKVRIVSNIGTRYTSEVIRTH